MGARAHVLHFKDASGVTRFGIDVDVRDRNRNWRRDADQRVGYRSRHDGHVVSKKPVSVLERSNREQLDRLRTRASSGLLLSLSGERRGPAVAPGERGSTALRVSFPGSGRGMPQLGCRSSTRGVRPGWMPLAALSSLVAPMRQRIPIVRQRVRGGLSRPCSTSRQGSRGPSAPHCRFGRPETPRMTIKTIAPRIKVMRSGGTARSPV